MATAPPERPSYGAGARILGAGVGATGLVTFAYFAVLGHSLADVPYKRVALLWSAVTITITVLYRPVEQTLSRSIAARRPGHPLRTAALLTAGFAGAFLVVALALRAPLERAWDGSGALYGAFVVAVLMYGGSYVARGWTAGHGRFELYGGLVLAESTVRLLFAVAVAAGVAAAGERLAGAGIAVAPALSLLVVSFALRGAARVPTGTGTRAPLRGEAAFAGSAFAIQLAEQGLVGGAVVIVAATATDPALAGFAFNVLLIARAPLVLFQAVQASLLPHLAGGGDARAAIRPTLVLVAAFSGLSALVLLALGPALMGLAFGDGDPYARGGLALVALGMGFHLAAGTLTQRSLAAGRAGWAARVWLGVAALFLVWVALPVVGDELLRVEAGYCAATALLAAAMAR